MVDKQFASVNNVPPEPWTGQDTRDRGMRCLIAPHFLALSVFGAQHNDMGGTLVRSIGLVRATARIGLKNLAYNMRRLVGLQRLGMVG